MDTTFPVYFSMQNDKNIKDKISKKRRDQKNLFRCNLYIIIIIILQVNTRFIWFFHTKLVFTSYNYFFIFFFDFFFFLEL